MNVGSKEMVWEVEGDRLEGIRVHLKIGIAGSDEIRKGISETEEDLLFFGKYTRDRHNSSLFDWLIY